MASMKVHQTMDAKTFHIRSSLVDLLLLTLPACLVSFAEFFGKGSEGAEYSYVVVGRVRRVSNCVHDEASLDNPTKRIIDE